MAELDDIETAIIALAKDVSTRAEQGHSRDKVWTENLLRALASLGHSKKLHVSGDYCSEYGQGEWLYDQVWLDRDHETNAIIDVPLILESEWASRPKKINDDFQKLLLGRAQHRIMIFQNNDVPHVFETLKNQIRFCKRTQPGDRYLLLGWQYAKDHKEWKIELYVA